MAKFTTPPAMDITPILHRIGDLVGSRTQVRIAEALNVRQSSVSDAKRRGSVPSEWLLTLWRAYGVCPDWIMTGQGPQFLVAKDADAVRVIPNIAQIPTGMLLAELGRRLETQTTNHEEDEA